LPLLPDASAEMNKDMDEQRKRLLCNF